MKFHAVLAPAMLALLALLGAPARAADACGPLKLLSTVRMLPVKGDPGGVRFLPVGVNDKPALFLLDTGGLVSQISPQTAQDMKLDERDTRFDLYDVNGDASHKAVTLDRLTVGAIAFSHLRMPVSALGWKTGGVLSPDILVPYDIDLDFPGNRMRVMSPDHCPGNVLYWKAGAVGVVPITLDHARIRPPVTRFAATTNVTSTRIMVQVTLDGRNFNAVLDTGSTYSTMSDGIAKYLFHLPLGDPHDRPIRAINGDPSLTGYLHTFGKLSFGGVTIDNPQIMLLEDRMSRAGDRSQQTFNRALTNNANLHLAELVIGMNMLKDLHVYIAFAERKLYLTQAAASGAAPAKP